MKKEKERFLPTRRSLLERLKAWDDQEGWKQFYDLYWQLIYGVGRRAGLGHSEAEDLVQDTVVAVAKKMPGFEYNPKQCTFKSWLLLVTRSRLSNIQRKLKSRIPRAENILIDESLPHCTSKSTVADESMEKIWNEEWAKNIMDQAIRKVKQTIPSEQYQIFDLYVLKEIDGREIAKTLGISLSKVYVTKHRVSKLVKKTLQAIEQDLDK